MLNNKLLTFTLLLMQSFNYFEEASGIVDINASIAVNASHNENNCIMHIVREHFKRNTTVTIFLSNDAQYTQMESNLIQNIFNSINCSIVLYTQMTRSRVIIRLHFSNNQMNSIIVFCTFRWLLQVSGEILFSCWATEA